MKILNPSLVTTSIFLIVCFLLMVRIGSKSRLLTLSYLLAALVPIVVVTYELNYEYIIIGWMFSFVLAALGWIDFYYRHKHFFQFTNYDKGAAVVYYDVDEKGTIKWANSEASKLIGYTPSELIGKTAEDLIEPGESFSLPFTEARRKTYTKIKEEGKADVTYTYKRKDGHLVRLRTFLYPRFENHELKGFIGISMRA